MGRASRLKRKRLQVEITPPGGSSFPPPRREFVIGRYWGWPLLLSVGLVAVHRRHRLIIEVSPFTFGLVVGRSANHAAVRLGPLVVTYSKISHATLSDRA
jgi:hypothetical protein